jgi:hypothetical protein
MIDRMAVRREFLREGSASRIRRLAANLEAICERFANGAEDAVVREKIDESSWMIEWAVPAEAPDIQAELVELQRALAEWRTLEANGPARALARDRVCTWAERLLWVSALLEATS